MHNKNYNNWINNIKIEKELLELKKNKQNSDYLKERFSDYLVFGTGGLRGVMGLGTSFVNNYTITKVSVGLANFLNKQKNLPKLIVIAYDNRKNSDKFAKLSAQVFAENGIKVKLFNEPTPTPVLSFAVRNLNAGFGVNITSSHNSKIYNGYKVVNNFGYQINTEESVLISNEINKANEFKELKNSYSSYVKNKDISILGNSVLNKFINETINCLPQNLQFNNNLKLVYSPLNGTGYKAVSKALSKVGFSSFHTPKMQQNPDPNFTTTPNPNPELIEVYVEGIKLAKKQNAHVIITTDPDCDRMGVMVKHNNSFKFLTGDQIGIILLNFLIENKKILKNSFAVNSVVSSPLAKIIASRNNVKLFSTLTGFKNIAGVMNDEINRINILEKENNNKKQKQKNSVIDNENSLGNQSFIFAYEESNGYLTSTHIRDKDGIAPTLLITALAGELLKESRTLIDYLNDIYAKYGYIETKVYSNQFSGYTAKADMDNTVNKIRQSSPKKIAGKKIIDVIDYLNSEKTGLEKSNFITLKLKNKSTITIRPSGTEPKLKVYLSVQGNSVENCNKKLNKLQKVVNKKLLKL